MPNSETEYSGKNGPNSVTESGPEGRQLSSSEQLRLSYLTGQMEDPNAPAKDGFFKGVDPDYPEIDG